MGQDRSRDMLSRRQRWLGSGIALLIAIIVLVVTKSILWGMLTFVLATIGVNVFLLWLRDRRSTPRRSE